LAAIAGAFWKATRVDLSGLDLALDARGRLWLLEANSAPILKCGSMAAVFLALAGHHAGYVDEAVRRTLEEIGRCLEDEQERLDGVVC
jgi:D-alanine-D-alanine ligase-like ATP-grasp enzyme